MPLDRVLARLRQRITPTRRAAFLACFIAGYLIHLFAFTNIIPNSDGLSRVFDPQQMTVSGRWFLHYASFLNDFTQMPALIGFFSMVFLALAAAGVVTALNLHSRALSAFAGVLMAAFPCLGYTFLYMFTASAYCLAILLAAALALSCAACGSSNDTQSTASGSTGTTASAESASQEEETATSTDASKETDTPAESSEEADASTESAAETGSEPSEEAPTSTEESADETASSEQSSGSNILIAYFTAVENSGVDAVASASYSTVNGEAVGRLRAIADMIQQNTGGDLFSIRTSVVYPTDGGELIDYAAQEQDENARPELTSHIENLDQYDTIFVGYPNWWADLPMAVYSFFDEYDFSGKTIIPFNVHNGSRFSRTIETIQELEPNATVIEDGFTISEQNVPEAADDVASWLQEIGY